MEWGSLMFILCDLFIQLFVCLFVIVKHVLKYIFFMQCTAEYKFTLRLNKYTYLNSVTFIMWEVI